MPEIGIRVHALDRKRAWWSSDLQANLSDLLAVDWESGDDRDPNRHVFSNVASVRHGPGVSDSGQQTISAQIWIMEWDTRLGCYFPERRRRCRRIASCH